MKLIIALVLLLAPLPFDDPHEVLWTVQHSARVIVGTSPDCHTVDGTLTVCRYTMDQQPEPQAPAFALPCGVEQATVSVIWGTFTNTWHMTIAGDKPCDVFVPSVFIGE